MNLKLKMAFIKRGNRQIEAAQSIGMDPSKLSKVINGWVRPTREERNAICEYLSKSESELFSDQPSTTHITSIQ
jgi:DNA-binding Xre family transcriptional regulator